MELKEGQKYLVTERSFINKGNIVEIIEIYVSSFGEKYVTFKVIEINKNSKHPLFVYKGEIFDVIYNACKEGFTPIKNKIKKL